MSNKQFENIEALILIEMNVKEDIEIEFLLREYPSEIVDKVKVYLSKGESIEINDLKKILENKTEEQMEDGIELETIDKDMSEDDIKKLIKDTIENKKSLIETGLKKEDIERVDYSVNDLYDEYKKYKKLTSYRMNVGTYPEYLDYFNPKVLKKLGYESEDRVFPIDDLVAGGYGPKCIKWIKNFRSNVEKYHDFAYLYKKVKWDERVLSVSSFGNKFALKYSEDDDVKRLLSNITKVHKGFIKNGKSQKKYSKDESKEFTVINNGESYYFRILDDIERKEWIDRIEAIIEYNSKIRTKKHSC